MPDEKKYLNRREMYRKGAQEYISKRDKKTKELRDEIKSEIDAKHSAMDSRKYKLQDMSSRERAKMRAMNRVMGNEPNYIPENADEYRKEAMRRLAKKEKK